MVGDSRVRVSIIINNHNYGRFLPAAIESAMEQTHLDTEIIVVDDGSRDASRGIIAGYGDRIVPVLKERGGQASACNAGFARSRGDVAIFLDSDDILLPDTARRVAEIVRSAPGVAKVLYRLAVIDDRGTPTGAFTPPASRPLPLGDLRLEVLQFPDDISWPPTSGNAFPPAVLQRIMPIPEEAYQIAADYYLSNLTPLFGAVAALDETGGYYRVHGANASGYGAWDSISAGFAPPS